MRHTFWTLLLLTTLLCLTPAGISQAQSPDTPGDVRAALVEQETVRVIVALRAAPAVAVGLQIAEVARAQEQVMEDVPAEDFTLIHAYDTLPGLVGEVTPAGLDALLAQPDVAAVALDLPVESALAESVRLVQADIVHDALGFTGAGVNVAVLDTGVEVTHPDLADHIIAEKCFNRAGCPPDDADEGERAEDNNSHGTHVAGIISSAGQVSPPGVAPDAGLVAVRVLNDSGSGFTSDVLAGLDWVMANQARFDIKLINLSLGGGRYSGVCDEADANTRLYADAVALARSAGMTLFAASGNSGLPEQLMAPACVSGVVAVGSSYDADFGSFSMGSVCFEENAMVDQVACSSNSSPELDLLAPGASILSTGLNGGQTSKSGTSMATAVASGVAALMLEADPALTPEEIETILEESGLPVEDERNGRVTPRVDALAAVSAVSDAEAVMFSGTVLLEGRTDQSGTQVILSQTPCPDVISAEPTTTTATDGHFEVELLTGQSDICLQLLQPGYLSGQRLNPDGDLGQLTLLGGDINGDNLIDIFDLSLIGVRFDSTDPATDINADGIVDIFDLVITAGNYNRAGPLTEWE